MNQFDPKKIKIIKDVPPKIDKSARIALDLEMYGMDKKKLHRPNNGNFASLACTFDGKTVYMIFDTESISGFLSNIDAGVWILHNSKFDITHLRRWTPIPQRKRLWDTMLIEQIMYSGYYEGFSLADVVRRRLGIYMEKEVREQFITNDTGQMTKEQIEYAAIDVIADWQVYQSQRAEIDENDLRIYKDIELPFLWCLLAMSGVKLDTEAWLKLAARNKKTADDMRSKYEGINLASPKQVKDNLHRLKFKVDDTSEETLKSIQEECEFAKDVLFFRSYAKRASTYGEKFIESHVENDGRVYADLYQIGAETGRTSCRAPNLQNQPNEEEYRKCFVAGEENCMVIADWSSQEPRIAAYLSQDEFLIETFQLGKDLYIEIAKKVFHEKITKSDPRRRKIKDLVLGIFYGMSAYGLARRLDISEDEAQEMLDAFFEACPGVMEYVQKQSHAKGFVQSIYGRKIWLNHYTNQSFRNALNAPIQSSAADAMKLATRRFLDKWAGEDFYTMTPLLLLVHDEIVIEVPELLCEPAKEMLGSAMVEVANEMHEGIKGSVDTYVGKNWASKH